MKVDPKNTFMEKGSGGDATRPILKEAIQRALDLRAKGKKVFFIVRDDSRWFRNLRHGMAASIELYENDVPMVFVLDNRIVGTLQRPDDGADTMFGIMQVIAGAEREKLRKRVLATIKEKKDEGVFVRAGLVLYPNADVDVWDWLLEHQSKSKKKSEGGLGGAEFGRFLEASVGKSGPKGAWWRRALPNLLTIKSELTPKEWDEWVHWRKRVRAFEKSEGYDGAAKGEKGKVSFKVKAIRHRYNGYLTKPFEKNWRKPTNDDWDEIISNPTEHLSASDLKLYSKLVSKRGGGK